MFIHAPTLGSALQIPGSIEPSYVVFFTACNVAIVLYVLVKHLERARKATRRELPGRPP